MPAYMHFQVIPVIPQAVSSSVCVYQEITNIETAREETGKSRKYAPPFRDDKLSHRVSRFSDYSTTSDSSAAGFVSVQDSIVLAADRHRSMYVGAPKRDAATQTATTASVFSKTRRLGASETVANGVKRLRVAVSRRLSVWIPRRQGVELDEWKPPHVEAPTKTRRILSRVFRRQSSTLTFDV